MYSYEILPEARDQVDGLPVSALSFYPELIAFLELTPWDAPAYRDDNPDGNLRKIVFGSGAEGIAVYLILEESAPRRGRQRDLDRLSRSTAAAVSAAASRDSRSGRLRQP